MTVFPYVTGLNTGSARGGMPRDHAAGQAALPNGNSPQGAAHATPPTPGTGPHAPKLGNATPAFGHILYEANERQPAAHALPTPQSFAYTRALEYVNGGGYTDALIFGDAANPGAGVAVGKIELAVIPIALI